MGGLKAWFASLSQREQRLIALMGAIAVPVLLWLAVWRPLSNAHEAALDDYRLALDRHGRIAAMTGNPAGEVPPAPVIDGSLASWLLAHASERGMVLASQEDVAANRADVTLGTASASEAARWLTALEAEGLRVEAIELTPSANGGVDMSATIGVGR